VPVRRNIQSVWIWSCLLLAITPALARSQAEKKPEASKPGERKPEYPAREAYLQALEKLAKGQGGSMQSLFTLALTAAQEQLQSVLEWDKALAAGKIPKKRFDRRLPGFHVGTVDALFVVPDSRFFLELARRRGNEVDRRFFDLLNQTFNGGRSRTYMDPITDVHACYHLGSREFIALYRGWTQFKSGAPAAYQATVNEELQGLEQALLTATCVCGTPEIVDAGFEGFLKTFPKSPIAPQVRQRLEKLHAKTGGFLFRCGKELNVGQPLPHGVPTPPPFPAAPEPPK
jgi:hypothetical protein